MQMDPTTSAIIDAALDNMNSISEGGISDPEWRNSYFTKHTCYPCKAIYSMLDHFQDQIMAFVMFMFF